MREQQDIDSIDGIEGIDETDQTDQTNPTDKSGETGGIDEQLTGLIHSWFARLRGQISAGKSEFLDGQTILERDRILLTIGCNGEIAQKHLAQRLNVSPQSMSESLYKLENDGYVARNKSRLDKRETIVTLTPEGKAHSDELAQKMRRQAHRFLEPLSTEEKKTLYSLLKKLTDRG